MVENNKNDEKPVIKEEDKKIEEVKEESEAKTNSLLSVLDATSVV